MWASCDRHEKKEDCEFMLEKFSPLMTTHAASWKVRAQTELEFQLHNATERQSNYVCARHGLAGLGSLNDHGIGKGHGWERSDYHTTHNHGRGGQFWRFRNFMMTNLGFNVSDAPPPMVGGSDGLPLIVFSEHSSKLGARSFSFTKHIERLQEVLKGTAQVQSYTMKKFSLQQQAALVSRAAIYVTGCGGGAVSAAFLPRGASLILYYQELGGVENNRRVGLPARLDWDYFNNVAYNRVHWMPSSNRTTDIDVDALVVLVQHDLEMIRAEREMYLKK